MIVEVFGMPGSGKSYFANRLVKEMEKDGIKAVNMTEYMNTTVLGRAEKKVLYYMIQASFRASNIKNKVISCIPNNKNWKSEFQIYHSAEFCINTLSLILYIQRKYTKKKVYIFDEGALHTIIKMLADFNISVEETQKLKAYVIKKIKKNNGIMIYNQISVDDCIKSIKKRNRHVCAFDEFSGEKLVSILNKYQKACEFIAIDSEVIKIERRVNIEKNIETVKKYIKMKGM